MAVIRITAAPKSREQVDQAAKEVTRIISEIFQRPAENVWVII